ncbi:cilia and flagella-associated protein 47-like [Onthophagus taurus]|uniref:cilia and flagella-associated protein 47-like n=1 Tax=Onthophagus taurus TaxID=166361 RepID=UPI0039BECBDE
MDGVHESNDFVEISNIRIYPARLEFSENLEKRAYKSKITLQNIGTCRTCVRILEPSSKYYKIQSFPRGRYLSAGLKIIVPVEILYAADDNPDSECLVPVYVNDKRHDYLILLKSSKGSMSITPEIVDFGLINAGSIHITKTIVLENKANKDLIFYVDRNACSSAIIIEPLKGKVRMAGIYEISIKIFALQETDLNTSFSIKCAYSITPIYVKGKVINSKLEALHPNTTEHFTLLEFPPTYFGLSSVVNLFVRNYSAIPMMYSTMGEIHQRRVSLESIKKESINFKFFDMYPTNGFFHENETKLFIFRFSPRQLDSNTKNNRFYFCTILMHRFRSVALAYQQDFISDLAALVSANTSIRNTLSLEPSLSQLDLTESLTYDSILSNTGMLQTLSPDAPNEFTRVHLYATAEVPGVDIIPDEINIKRMDVNKCVKRVLLLTNKSKNLPIIVQYVKAPNVYLAKEIFSLEPTEKLEILINIQPTEIGSVEIEVVFNLLYYDYNMMKTKNDCKVIGESKMVVKLDVISSTKYPKPQLNPGLKPNYIKEVGKHCQNLKFNTNISLHKGITVNNKAVIDKNCNDLIAFPNDTQQSIRPYRNKQLCRTIFARQEKYKAPLDEYYELSETDICFKKSIRDYYINFIRSEFKKLTSPNEDGEKSTYQTTLMYKVLCEDLTVSQPPPIRGQKLDKTKYYVPLIPQEMDNIIITPPVVQTGQIANNADYIFKLKIENKNNIPVRILLKSDKFSLVFSEGSRHNIDPCQEAIITMCYKTAYVGYYSTNLYVIVNESAAHAVPIITEVVANVLQMSKKCITFTNRNLQEYVELTNILNIPIPFSWVCIDHNFGVEPGVGMVAPKSKLTCTCRYFTTISGPNETEGQLYCGETMRQKLKFESQITLQNISVLDREIDFGEIPLNEPVLKSILLKNTEIIPLSFLVEDCENCVGLTIYPLNGVLRPACVTNVYVTAKVPTCVKFKYNLRICTVGAGYVEVLIKGIVIYPNVIITPNIINFPKIPASTTSKIQFTVKNDSSALIRVNFNLNEYEEFDITNSDDLYKFKFVQEITLHSQETKTLFLNFHPSGIQRTTFYIPLIINNILGPPILLDTISTKVKYHLTATLDDCVYIKTPDYMPCVKIQTLVTSPKVIFSKTAIEMLCTCNNPHDEYILSIKNKQSEKEGICIRIDNLKYPVYMTYESGAEVVKTKCAYATTLDPDEETRFRIIFKPNQEDFGEFRVLLPVFLHSDNSFKYHTIINIHTVYQTPVIVATAMAKPLTPTTVKADNHYLHHFEPSPVFGGKVKFYSQMLFKYHRPDCKILKNDVKSIHKSYIEILYNTKVDKGKDMYSIMCVFTYEPKVESTFNVIWYLECTCGANRTSYTEGTVSNCIFTSYCLMNYILKRSDIRQKNIEYTYENSSYPFYPNPTDKHYNFMEGFVEAVESWLCTQVYFGQWRYEIPCTMISYNLSVFEPPPPDCLKKQIQFSRIPLVHLLGNLVGPEILQYLLPTETPKNEVESIKYRYQVFSRALEFIRKQGAFIGYLRPEYLFLYYDFCIYKRDLFNYKSHIPYPLTVFVNEYKEFARLSRHSWLDFLLQIYKTLYLNKLITKYREFGTTGKLKDTPLGDFYKYENTIESQPDIYGKNEMLIFCWLEYNYETNKAKIWKNPSKKKYKIEVFNGALNDGIIFAATLGTYCPYLIPFLQNVYLEPANTEESFHNVTKVIECLEMLNYSFKVTIEQIVNGSAMKTFMLAVYLFEILPYLHPKDTITLETGLSTKITRKIEIYNENSFPIAYKTIFIGNDDKCFAVGCKNFQIPAKKSVKLPINYMARFIKNIECVLLLSGEIVGYRYASNKVITLIGIPDLQYASSTISYTNELFKSMYFNFKVKSPYKEKASYKMQQTYDTLHEALELSTVIYHLDKNRITCARLIVLNKTFDFDENGLCSIRSVNVNIINATISIWLYFTNETVGDFGVQVISKVKDSKERDILYVQLPKFIDELRERPDSLYINIPNRDKLFFNAIKTLLVQITEGDESALWQKITDTPMGINILENFFATYTQDQFSLLHQCKSVTYNVIVNESAVVVLPEIIKFEDECSSSFSKIPIALKHVDEYPQDFDFVLESQDTRRRRFYTVRFL